MNKNDIAAGLMIILVFWIVYIAHAYKNVTGETVMALREMKEYCEEKAITGECIIVFIDKRKMYEI